MATRVEQARAALARRRAADASRDEDRRERERVRQQLVRLGRSSTPADVDAWIANLRAGLVDPPTSIPARAETSILRRPFDALSSIPRGVYQGGAALFDLIGAEPIADTLLDRAQMIRERQSPEYQAQVQELADAEGLGLFTAAARNRWAVADLAAESLPYFAGGAGGARLALTAARGLGRTLSPVTAAAIGEGGLVGAVEAGQARGEGVPIPRALMTGGAAAVTTGLFGAIGGTAARRLGAADAEALFAGQPAPGAWRRQLAAAPIEMGEEFLQEGAQQAVSDVGREGETTAARVRDAAITGFIAAAPLSGSLGVKRAAAAAAATRLATAGTPARTPRPMTGFAERVSTPRFPNPRRERLIPGMDPLDPRPTHEGIDAAIRADVDREAAGSTPIGAEFARGQGAEMLEATSEPTPRLEGALEVIGDRSNVSLADNERASVAAVRRDVEARRVRARLEAAGDEDGVKRLDAMTDRELARADRGADLAAPDAPARMNERDPRYRENHLYDLVRTGRPEDAAPVAPETRLPNPFDESPVPVPDNDPDAPYLNLRNQLAADVAEDVRITRESGGEAIPFGAPIRRAMLARLENMNEREVNRAVGRAAGGRAAGALQSVVERETRKDEAAVIDAENAIRADAGLPEARAEPDPVSVKLPRAIGAVPAVGPALERLASAAATKARGPWRHAVTEYGQKSVYARSAGDVAAWRGETPYRPTAERDLAPESEVEQVRLFGDAEAAMKRHGYTAEDRAAVVTGGQIAPDAPADVRAGIELGLLTAAQEARDAGLLRPDQDVSTAEGALRAVESLQGAESTNTTQAAEEGAVRVAERARLNRSDRMMVDWVARYEGAPEVGEATDSTISVTVDGAPHHFKVDPWIAGFQKESRQFNAWPVLRAVGKLFRHSVLTLNPRYQVRAAIMDQSRTAISDPLIGPAGAAWEALSPFAYLGGWPEAAQAARGSPMERRLLEEDAGPLTKEWLANVRRLEELGAKPAEGRAEFAAELGGKRGRTYDVGRLLEGGEETEGALAKAGGLMKAAVLAPVTLGQAVMTAADARTRLRAAERFRRAEGREPDIGAALRFREDIGSPPVGDAYSPVSGVPVAALQFYSAAVNGMIAQWRVHRKPETAAAANLKLATTILAPAAFQAMARANVWGGEDDDTPWGDYVRGLKEVPWYAMTNNVLLPFSLRRGREGGEDRERSPEETRDRFDLLEIPVNRDYKPVLDMMAAAAETMQAGGTGGEAAGAAGLALATEMMPSLSAGIDLAMDAAVALKGGNPKGSFDRDLFTRREEDLLTPVDKTAKFLLVHAPSELGSPLFQAAGGWALQAMDKEHLKGYERQTIAGGGWLEEVSVGEGLRGLIKNSARNVARGFASTGGGRAQTQRRTAEIAARRRRRVDAFDAPVRLREAVAGYIAGAPDEFDPTGINAAAWQFASTEQPPEAIARQADEYAESLAVTDRDEVSRLRNEYFASAVRRSSAARAREFAVQAVRQTARGREYAALLTANKADGEAIIRRLSPDEAPIVRSWLIDMVSAGALSGGRGGRFETWLDALARREGQAR